MKETNDLFETLASGTACDYISDLRLAQNRERVRGFLMGWTPAQNYGVRQWRIWQSICSAGRTRSLHRKRRKSF